MVRKHFNVVVSWQNLTNTTLGVRPFHHTVQLEDSRYLICHHPVSRMPCLSPSSKFSTNSMPFLSTSFKFSTKAVSCAQFLEAILLVNLLENGLLFQACLNQSSCLWKEVEQFKGASNAYIYIYIYVIGSHSSSSKNSISQLFGLWMKTTTLVLGELLKGQVYVPCGSLARHNLTSSEFRVLVTVSLATWLRVCCNSSFFGALDRSYQVVAVNNRWYTVVVNFITRDFILTASELAFALSISSYEV